MAARARDCKKETQQGFGTRSCHLTSQELHSTEPACIGGAVSSCCPGWHASPWARSAGGVMYIQRRDVPCVRGCHRLAVSRRLARASSSQASGGRQSPGGWSGQCAPTRRPSDQSRVGAGVPHPSCHVQENFKPPPPFLPVEPAPSFICSISRLDSLPCCLPYLPYREPGTVLSARCPSSARPLSSPSPSTNKILTKLVGGLCCTILPSNPLGHNNPTFQ